MFESFDCTYAPPNPIHLGKLHCFIGIKQKEAHVSSRWLVLYLLLRGFVDFSGDLGEGVFSYTKGKGCSLPQRAM